MVAVLVVVAVFVCIVGCTLRFRKLSVKMILVFIAFVVVGDVGVVGANLYCICLCFAIAFCCRCSCGCCRCCWRRVVVHICCFGCFVFLFLKLII